MKNHQNENVEKHWHGRFYRNRNDRRILIRRRGGLLAWTMNFANWRSWALIAAELMAVAALVVIFHLM